MHEVFQIKDRVHYFLRNQRDFVILTVKSVNYGLESIRFFGPKKWKSLPNNLKNKELIESFKMAIKEWKPESCLCRLCKTYLQNIGYLQQENLTRQIQTRTYFFISFVIDFLNTVKILSHRVYMILYLDLFFNVFLLFLPLLLLLLSQGVDLNQHVQHFNCIFNQFSCYHCFEIRPFALLPTISLIVSRESK